MTHRSNDLADRAPRHSVKRLVGTAVPLFRPNLTAARTHPGSAIAINVAREKDIQSSTYQSTVYSTRRGAALSITYVGHVLFISQPPGQPKFSKATTPASN